MPEQFDPFDETVRVWEGDAIGVLDGGDTDVMGAVTVEELTTGDAVAVQGDVAWDPSDLSRVALQLDRYRCRRTSWF